VLEVTESEQRKDEKETSHEWVKVVRKGKAKKNKKVNFLNVEKGFTNVNQTYNNSFPNKTGLGNKRDASDCEVNVRTK
jgi:hypothetical protein